MQKTILKQNYENFAASSQDEWIYPMIGPVWGCDRLVIRAKVIENQIMAASAIAISSDSSDESVGSPPSRVILFGDIPTVIPSTSVVAPETSTIAPVISSAAPVVETTLVASPTGLCGLIPYSEVEQFDSFMLVLNSVVMMATRNDKVFWSFDSLGKFSSMSFGKEMENSSYSDPVLHSNQSRCPLCNSCTESVDHLIIHYNVLLGGMALLGSKKQGNFYRQYIFLLASFRLGQIQQWCPPVVGSFKFNVNGAARGKRGPASIGGVLRNNCGVVLAVFSISVGALDSNVAKVMEIKEAYRMVNENLDLSASRIIVESDSLNAVSWVRHPLERPWRLLSHFQEIDLFLSTNNNRSISHIKREGNCEADKLAKEGVFRSVPLSIWNL
ncbi:reverse transcriptase [Tanacetum coccineum]